MRFPTSHRVNKSRRVERGVRWVDMDGLNSNKKKITQRIELTAMQDRVHCWKQGLCGKGGDGVEENGNGTKIAIHFD